MKIDLAQQVVALTALLKPRLLGWQTARTRWPQELLAGVMLGIIVTPQSLGYAMLAGLPAVYGLYVSIIPVVVYAFWGASRLQAVGPVAVTAILTAQALLPWSHAPVSTYVTLAALLGLLTGVWMLLAGLLRFGWLTQLISQGVMGGFITGSAILIAIGQLGQILGVKLSGASVWQLGQHLFEQASHIHPLTTAIGASSVVVLLLNRYGLNRWMSRLEAKARLRTILSTVQRFFPLFWIAVALIASTGLHWAQQGVRVVGALPLGLPSLAWPQLPAGMDFWDTLQRLLPLSGLIALVSFISAASVGQFLARQARQSYDSNRELVGLGLANLAGGFWHGHPITGGFSRTAVAVTTGGKTQLTGLGAAAIMLLMLLLLAPLIEHLPLTVLSALIMVAVLGMLDVAPLKLGWHADRVEALSWLVTFAAVLLLGLSNGLLAGLFFSLAALIWRTRQPHVAILGQMRGHAGQLLPYFRNIRRHDVQTWPELLMIRIDESLYFGNVDGLQARIGADLAAQPALKHLLLDLSAVNHIDLAGQSWLVSLAEQLNQHQQTLELIAIKGPVLDQLRQNPAVVPLLTKHWPTLLAAVQHLTTPLEPEYVV